MNTRRLSLRSLQIALFALSINLIGVAPAIAGQAKTLNFPQIKIKNFGQMDEHFFRGAQPREEDFKDLAALGIQTIIDLRNDPVNYEKRAVELAGMHYVNIPMSASARPREEQIDQFLALAKDPATGSFFVHCEGGRHRTGLMGAVYRMNHDGWDFDQTYKEMKNYDFYTRWGHGAIKDYVQDYSGHLRSINVSTGQAGSNY